jgi:hypothetical protein
MGGRAALVLAVALAACGYRPAYTSGSGGGRLHVVLAHAPVASSVAADEVVSGVRDELAREGGLAPGDGYPRVEVEVTRLDEAADAIAAGAAGTVPAARATAVGVVARAWLVRAEGAEHERDTGDVRVLLEAGATTPGDATESASASAVDALHHDDALRAAARRAGVRLARRVLGQPAPEGDLAGDP